MSNLSFKDYILSLSHETLMSDDIIPFYDNSAGDIKRGTIIQPLALANHTPIFYWSWWTGATATVTSCKYTLYGFLLYFELHATITSKGTCTGDFTIGTYTSASSVKYPLSWWVYASGGITSRWLPYEESGTIKFISSAPTTNLDWSAISVGDLIFISWFYEI